MQTIPVPDPPCFVLLSGFGKTLPKLTNFLRTCDHTTIPPMDRDEARRADDKASCSAVAPLVRIEPSVPGNVPLNFFTHTQKGDTMTLKNYRQPALHIIAYYDISFLSASWRMTRRTETY